MDLEITACKLSSLLTDPTNPPLLLDVREPWEWDIGHIEGSMHIPMQLIPVRHTHLPADKLIVAICHHGVRSLQVCHFLRQTGFGQVVSLAGGIDAWSSTIDPSITRY